MTMFKIKRGLESQLPSEILNGTMYFCTDTGNIFIDMGSQRKQISGEKALKDSEGNSIVDTYAKKDETLITVEDIDEICLNRYKAPGVYNGNSFTSWQDLLDTGAFRVVDGAVSPGAILPENTPEKNEYGFFYGALYSFASAGFVFNEDTTVEMYQDGVLVETFPAGLVQYGVGSIDMSALEFGVAVVSADGYSVTLADVGLTFYFGTPYTPTGELVLPNNGTISSISFGAFAFSTGLTSISIPDSVTSIGDGAFQDCTGLTSVTFGKNSQLGSIGENAFSGCSSLTSISIPDSVTSIGENAFYGCSSLTSINIPDGVTSIGEYAFYGYSSLTSVTFGKNSQLESIGNNAFSYCIGLTSIAIPDRVTSIDQQAFYGCTGLTSVTFGKNSQLESIGNSAFCDCTGLTSISIPDSVTSISKYAFRGCSGLRSATVLAETPPTLGSTAFYGCAKLATIYVPASSVSAYKTAWSEYANKIVAIG